MKKSLYIQNRALAFTLVELMVTLAIVSVVIGLGVSRLGSSSSLSNLKQSRSRLENLLRKAQSEAQARSLWTCVKIDSTTGTGTITTDEDGNHGSIGACGNSGDQIAFTQPDLFLGSTTIAECSIARSCVIWFNSSGNPMTCRDTGCGDVLPTGVCAPWDYQIVLSTPSLNSGTRSRELEVSRHGTFNHVPLGEKGQITDIWAKIPPFISGGCE